MPPAFTPVVFCGIIDRYMEYWYKDRKEGTGRMKKELLQNQNNWYKGNLHMHTTRSDGKVTPEEAKKIYYQAGYDFIALTDHRRPGMGCRLHWMISESVFHL